MKINRSVMMSLMVSLALISNGGTSLSQEKKASDQKMDETIRKWVEEHPEVIVEAVNGYLVKQKEKVVKEKNENIYKMSNDLISVSGEPYLGNEDAKVKIVYFLDAACAYCKRITPVLDNILKSNNDVKIIHRYVGFLTPASEYAGRVAALIGSRYRDKYENFYKNLMSRKEPLTQDLVNTVGKEVLGEKDYMSIQSEVLSPDAVKFTSTVKNNNVMAGKLGIDGTPFFYVDKAGEVGIIPGVVDVNRFNEAIQKARGEHK